MKLSHNLESHLKKWKAMAGQYAVAKRKNEDMALPMYVQQQRALTLQQQQSLIPLGEESINVA